LCPASIGEAQKVLGNGGTFVHLNTLSKGTNPAEIVNSSSPRRLQASVLLLTLTMPFQHSAAKYSLRDEFKI
jgi:hypothetical protein